MLPPSTFSAHENASPFLREIVQQQPEAKISFTLEQILRQKYRNADNVDDRDGAGFCTDLFVLLHSLNNPVGDVRKGMRSSYIIAYARKIEDKYKCVACVKAKAPCYRIWKEDDIVDTVKCALCVRGGRPCMLDRSKIDTESTGSTSDMLTFQKENLVDEALRTKPIIIRDAKDKLHYYRSYRDLFTRLFSPNGTHCAELEDNEQWATDVFDACKLSSTADPETGSLEITVQLSTHVHLQPFDHTSKHPLVVPLPYNSLPPPTSVTKNRIPTQTPEPNPPRPHPSHNAVQPTASGSGPAPDEPELAEQEDGGDEEGVFDDIPRQEDETDTPVPITARIGTQVRFEPRLQGDILPKTPFHLLRPQPKVKRFMGRFSTEEDADDEGDEVVDSLRAQAKGKRKASEADLELDVIRVGRQRFASPEPKNQHAVAPFAESSERHDPVLNRRLDPALRDSPSVDREFEERPDTRSLRNSESPEPKGFQPRSPGDDADQLVDLVQPTLCSDEIDAAVKYHRQSLHSSVIKGYHKDDQPVAQAWLDKIMDDQRSFLYTDWSDFEDAQDRDRAILDNTLRLLNSALSSQPAFSRRCTQPLARSMPSQQRRRPR